MGITFNGTSLTGVTYNGVELTKVTYNGTVVFESGQSEPDYLTFTANEPASIVLNQNGSMLSSINLYYRVNSGDWQEYTIGTTISLTTGQKCQWKGHNSRFSQDNNSYYGFSFTGYISASGNIMSLLDDTCQSLSVPNGAFVSLFNDGCETLVTPPKLPATTLGSDCYNRMFKWCTGLTSVPQLPATELKTQCYYHMFNGCTSLQVSDTQTAEAPYAWTIPTSGTLTNTSNQVQGSMCRDCPGTRSCGKDFPGVPGQSYTFYTQNPPV